MSSTAPIQWAQRKASVFFTILLNDVKDAKIDLSEDKMKFTGSSGGKTYTSDLEFFGALDKDNEASKYEVKPRSVTFHIQKKDDSVWWPRLLKDKSKEKNQVK